MVGESNQTDFSLILASPFELTGPVATFQQEAQAKGMAVIVTVGFMNLDQFYGEELEIVGEPKDE